MKTRTICTGLFTLLAFNSLRAQDIIITNDIKIIEAYQLEIGESRLFYTESESNDAPFVSILKSNVLVLKKSDGTKMLFDDKAPIQTSLQPAEKILLEPLPVEEEAVTEEEAVPANKIKPATSASSTGQHGFLLEPGNKVYIRENDENSCEAIVQRMIVKSVKEQGLWVLVDKPEHANFMIEYQLNANGNGRGILLIESKNSYFEPTHLKGSDLTKSRTDYLVIGSERVDEDSVLDNSAFGRKYCAKLKELMLDIQNGTMSDLMSEAKEYLDKK